MAKYVCLDPRDLNKAIQREHYPMKTVEEVAAQLSDAKVFSVLDATSGFWHIKLDEASTQLLTFNTPFGRYQYLRMPFGINSAPEVFQKKMTQAFEDLSGVKIIADDILIWGKDEDEHNFRLEQVLKRSRKVGLKLNRSKMKIMTTEVPYIGHILTANGLKPDPSKVQAVEEMPSPADKPALLRFLGMVNYMSKFIPNLAELTQPLRELLYKDVAWHWSERREKAFRSIKGKLTSDAILQYYDVEKSTTVSVDASSYGLGACLLQEGRPVCYASRSLNSAERNYAQIEKELLAIVYGRIKFHQYVYGKKVRVQTDHKSLEALFRKPLFQAPQRLQRMMLRLQRYDLQVEYEPGKNLYIADTLSRAPEGQNETAANSKDEFEVLIIENMPDSEEKLEQFSSVPSMKEINLSPAQMLPSLLEPQYPTDNIKEGLRRRAEIQQQYYNRHGKVLQPLNTGDTVRIRKPGQNTDHKSLEALFRKPLFQAPQRLQRMMLRLQRYDLQVEYEPGKNLYIADTLSRAPEGQNETAANSKDEFEVLIIENMPDSEEKLEQFKQETRKDPTLQKLKNTVLNGWPESKSQ